MIVIKDLRANSLGEPLFERVNIVIRPGERVAVVGEQEGAVSTFLRILSGEEESDRGTAATEGERLAYISPEMFLEGGPALGRLHHTRPTFIILDALAPGASETAIQDALQFIIGFRGGVLIAALDDRLIGAAKVTRVLELHEDSKSITSFTGSYENFCSEQNIQRARSLEAYEKQQREKHRLEEWLEVKRKEASRDKKAPEKGAVIRAKVKYLKREILDKELPKPSYGGETSETEE